MKQQLNYMKCVIHDVEYDEFYSPNTNTKTTCPICMEERYQKVCKQLEAAENRVELLLSVIELKSTQVLWVKS